MSASDMRLRLAELGDAMETTSKAIKELKGKLNTLRQEQRELKKALRAPEEAKK